MWMPAQTTRPPGATARSAAGTSAPTGAKMIAASSGAGAAAVESPAQAAPRPLAKSRPRVSPGRGEREHLGAAMDRELRHDVRRRAEAVEAEPPRRPRLHQRAVADEAGAEQRRRLLIGKGRRNGETVALVGDRVGGIAAVARIAGEAGSLAEILAARNAEAAGAARPSEPRHADARAERELLGARAARRDRADDLVAEHERQLRMRELAVIDVQIGAADAAGVNGDQDLALPRRRARDAARGELPPCALQQHRAHRLGHGCSGISAILPHRADAQT
jgi:hypothetical protein